MNTIDSAPMAVLESSDAIGPLTLIGIGVVLIGIALMTALCLPSRSERQVVPKDVPTATPKGVPTASANRRLDAWIFFAVLVFAVVLIAFGTGTAQMAGVGALVVAVAGAWFRKGRPGEAGTNRTDTGSISAKFLGVKYSRSWRSDAADRPDGQAL